MNFTPEQQQVIDLRDRNILVSAAAGSGKTAVLVERIISMVTEEKSPVDIDRLLVVTFTSAAAAEMRERISLAIQKRLAEDPGNVHLQRQSSLLHNAQITTIDSFCLFLIRNNFNDIGLDPGFRIADEGQLRLLRQDVLTELLEQKYQEKSPAFLGCVEYFTGGGNDKLLEEYVGRMYEFAMSYPWPEDWISQCKDDYKVTSVTEMEETGWCQYIVRYIRLMLGEWEKMLSECIRITEQPAGPYMYGEMLETEREGIQKLLKCKGFSEFYEAFGGMSFGRLSSKKDDTVDPLLREEVKKRRDMVKKQLEEIRQTYLVFSPEQVLARMTSAAPYVEELLGLVLEFKRQLDLRKRRDNLIDFHDMEHFALEILLEKEEDGQIHATAAAKEYRQYFKEVLIDEYQDSNLVQELLLKSVSGEEEGHFNRFMVGDVKQSIYKFRLARPELFMEKYDSYSKEEGKCQRIDLHKNFRSRHQVLDSVNDLFYRIMGKELGGVLYDEEAALYPGAEFLEKEGEEDPYRTEYLLIGKNEDNELTAREQEAAVLAGKIRKLYASLQVMDKETGKLRPVRYGDMVILLRTTQGWAEEFKGILEKEGIPAYVASRTGYYQASEIRVLMEYLRIIDNPLQDIPFYGALHSFFGDFTEEEISLVRARDKKKPLYRLFSEYAKEPEGGKAAEFLERLDRYRKQTAYTPIHKLIQNILTDTGYLDYVTARPGGEQRRANVEMLLTRAAAFEESSYYGLFHFLRYVQQLEKYEVEYGEADVLDENADVVRIMSIHKSKGLEFPVCFVAGLSKRFNMQDTGGRLIADADLGIGVDYVDSTLRLQSKTLKKSSVALKMRLDALGEELRILYVAMTRAREKLILSGLVPDLSKVERQLEGQRLLSQKEKEPLSFALLSDASSYLDFVLPCAEEVQLISGEELLLSEIREEYKSLEGRRKLLQEGGEAKEQTLLSLRQQFEKTYPYGYLSGLFVKTTVSELKKKAMEGETEEDRQMEQAFSRTLYEEPEVVPYIPAFAEEKESLSGTDRGSAYHRVMELLGLETLLRIREEAEKGTEKELLLQELERQMDLFVQEKKLTPLYRGAVRAEKLAVFLQSDLAVRMGRAAAEGKLFREQPFVLGIPANRLDPAVPEGETVLIQGIIDAFFEEDGRLVVVDYKTDLVLEGQELIRRYQVQLDYYKEALNRITGKEVSQKIIYSFALGQEIVLY